MENTVPGVAEKNQDIENEIKKFYEKRKIFNWLDIQSWKYKR